MIENLANMRMADVADVLLVAACLYVLLRWSQSNASRGLAIGCGLVFGLYLIAESFDLYLTSLVFRFGGSVAVVVFVVVFQDDIRRAVERAILTVRLRKRLGHLETRPHVETLLNTAFALATQSRGGLIVLAGSEPFNLHIEGGVELHGRISQPLLESVFDPNSSGHDGAVTIENGFVTRFGVHLPLSDDPAKSRGLGTRHRAAVGLCERTDALVVVVSEERGEVGLAVNGELRRNISRDALREALSAHLGMHSQRPNQRSHIVGSFLWRHPRTRVAALVLALVAWLAVASDRGMVQRTFVLPVEYRNVPTELLKTNLTANEVRVTFTGAERVFQFVAPSALKVVVDLKEAANGKDVFMLTEAQVRHPASLQVFRIEPSSIQLKGD